MSVSRYIVQTQVQEIYRLGSIRSQSYRQTTPQSHELNVATAKLDLTNYKLIYKPVPLSVCYI